MLPYFAKIIKPKWFYAQNNTVEILSTTGYETFTQPSCTKFETVTMSEKNVKVSMKQRQNDINPTIFVESKLPNMQTTAKANFGAAQNVQTMQKYMLKNYTAANILGFTVSPRISYEMHSYEMHTAVHYTLSGVLVLAFCFLAIYFICKIRQIEIRLLHRAPSILHADDPTADDIENSHDDSHSNIGEEIEMEIIN